MGFFGFIGSLVKYTAILVAVLAVVIAGVVKYNVPTRAFELEDVPDMTGKTVIVTGGNSGVGRVSVLEMYRKNADVIMATRSPKKAADAISDIKAEVTSSQGSLVYMNLDLSSLQSVKDFAEAFLAKHDKLDVLMNNAAVMAPPYGTNSAGYEMQHATNVLGPFYLTELLRPLLEKSAPSRIVNVASGAHRFATDLVLPPEREDLYEAWMWYAQTKLANIHHARWLFQQYEKSGVEVCATSLHPGFVDTNLMRNVGDLHGSFAVKIGDMAKSLFALTPEDGAITQLYLATAPDADKKCGTYHVPLGVEKAPTSYALDDSIMERLIEYCEAEVAKFEQQQES